MKQLVSYQMDEPEFERETDFLILVGVFLVEIEECSDKMDMTVLRTEGDLEGARYE